MERVSKVARGAPWIRASGEVQALRRARVQRSAAQRRACRWIYMVMRIVRDTKCGVPSTKSSTSTCMRTTNMQHHTSSPHVSERRCTRLLQNPVLLVQLRENVTAPNPSPERMNVTRARVIPRPREREHDARPILSHLHGWRGEPPIGLVLRDPA
jgi:hypothetical protein